MGCRVQWAALCPWAERGNRPLCLLWSPPANPCLPPLPACWPAVLCSQVKSQIAITLKNVSGRTIPASEWTDRKWKVSFYERRKAPTAHCGRLLFPMLSRAATAMPSAGAVLFPQLMPRLPWPLTPPLCCAAAAPQFGLRFRLQIGVAQLE